MELEDVPELIFLKGIPNIPRALQMLSTQSECIEM